MRKSLIFEGLYILLTVAFCIALDRLNKRLLASQLTSSLALLRYSDYLPLKYFVAAIVLASTGMALLAFFWCQIQRERFGFREMLAALTALLLNILAVLVIIFLINNPILRAVITVVAVGVGLVNSKS